MKINIVVKIQIEGLHFWKNCNIKEVMFLKNEHRHIFHITCIKEVKHGDRDVEIIQLKRNIINYLKNKYGIPCMFDGMSCEMIALELIKKYDLYSCEVLEDNENGALIFK